MLRTDYDDVFKIHFNFTKGKYDTYFLQSLITFDIETSNGWTQPDGHVIGFDHDKYNVKYDNDGNVITGDPEYKEKIDNGNPVSCLYLWQMAIENNDEIYTFMGRDYGDLYFFMVKLCGEIRRQAFYGFNSISRDAETLSAYNVCKNTVNAAIYIHNLGFEFQHLLNIYDDKFVKTKRQKREPVFARNSRKPMKITANLHGLKISFRDSYFLTNKSLKNWCEDEKLPVQKIDEDKDFYLDIRTPNTKLPDEVIQYGINDVECMVWGLRKYRDKYGTIENIPLTQTGEVRRTLIEKVAKVNLVWAKHCHNITINYSPDDFKRLVKLFQGGWVHANRFHIGKTVKNVKCYDFASSYPFCMCTKKYPIGEFVKCDVSEFDTLQSQNIDDPDYMWYMKVKVNNVVSKLDASYWSSSKTEEISNQILDNGKVYMCDTMTALMTDLDWDTFKKCYYYEDVEVLEIYKSKADYLPKELILTILEYFKYKTLLKGNPDFDSLYNESKQFINSVYGVAVTKVISMIVQFTDNGWETREPTDNEILYMLHDCIESRSFIDYQVGVWVPAWARHNLMEMVTKLDTDVRYCDTDSLKGPLTDDDIKAIDEYNNNVELQEIKVATTLGFDPDLFTATTNKGTVKRLGVFEPEHDCEEFRTLGAKRYVAKVDGEIECTIAGLPKDAGKNKIKSVDEFTNNLVWDTRESMKVIAKYNDNQPECIWTDSDGIEYKSTAKHGLCLQPTTFDLSIGNEFIKFLEMLQSSGINKEDEFFTDTPSWFFT